MQGSMQGSLQVMFNYVEKIIDICCTTYLTSFGPWKNALYSTKEIQEQNTGSTKGLYLTFFYDLIHYM